MTIARLLAVIALLAWASVSAGSASYPWCSYPQAVRVPASIGNGGPFNAVSANATSNAYAEVCTPLNPLGGWQGVFAFAPRGRGVIKVEVAYGFFTFELDLQRKECSGNFTDTSGLAQGGCYPPCSFPQPSWQCFFHGDV